MSAVVFDCLTFHHYLYGRKFICNSDHQPLEKIHLKHLSDAPPRLQRLLLKIQPYDITIKYIPGPKVPVADAPSRVNPSGNTPIKGLDVTIHEITPTHDTYQSTRNPTGYQKGQDTVATDVAINGRVARTLQKVTSFATTILVHRE